MSKTRLDDKWAIYEKEKRRLQEANLSPAEYQRAIRALAEKLKI